jgi:hypothetical protein
MSCVPEESAAILEAVSNPVRLPILLALEDAATGRRRRATGSS